MGSTNGEMHITLFCFLLLCNVPSAFARKCSLILYHDCVAYSGQLECSANATTTITHTSQLSALADCTTYTGNICISGVTLTAPTPTVTLTGNDDIVPSPTLTLHGIQDVQGSLTFEDIGCENYTINDNNIIAVENQYTVSAPDLQTVGWLTFNNIGDFALAFPELWYARGLACRSLDGNFQTLFVNKTNITIFNIALQDLDPQEFVGAISLTPEIFTGDPNMTQAMQFFDTSLGIYLSNNAGLNNVTWPGPVGALYAVNNGDDLQISLPDAQNVTLYLNGCSGLSAPSLESFGNQAFEPVAAGGSSSSVSALSNNTFASLDFPKLTSLNYLTLKENPYLAEVSLPAAQSVMQFDCWNNAKLQELALPQLSEIQGYMNVSGPFTK